MMERPRSDSALSIARTATLTLLVLASVCAPQVILRSASIGTPGGELWTSYWAGIGGFVVMLLVLRLLTKAIPRKALHQVASTHIGPWAGVVVAAARIVAYALVVMLGVEMVAIALSSTVGDEAWATWLPSILAFVLSLPVLIDRIFAPIRWAGIVVVACVSVVVALLLYGVVEEALGNIDYLAILQARQEAYEASPNLGSYYPYIEGALGALFPAAVLLLTSERIMVPPNMRRVGTRAQLWAFVPLLIVVGLTMYFIAKLELPGRRSGLPAMSIAAAFFEESGALVIAAVMIVIGICAAYAAYRQLPRLLRELALDSLLPRRLAAKDATGPRRTTVLVIAVLATIATALLESTHAVAMVFIFVCFFIALVSCVAMVQRSRTILNDSTHAVERRHARLLLIVFALSGLASLTVLGLIAWVQPGWALMAFGLLAVPAVLLGIYRKGQGKINQSLVAVLDPEARRIPTRVHGVVILERVDQPTIKAVSWARATKLSSITAVVVDVDEAATRSVREAWREAKLPVSLTVLGKPRGASRGPIIEHVRTMRSVHPHDVIQVFIPRILSSGSWDRFYVTHSTPRIVTELRMEPGVMVTEVPYRLDAYEAETTSTEDEQ